MTVQHVDVTLTIDGHSKGTIEQPFTCCAELTAKRSDKFAIRIQFLNTMHVSIGDVEIAFSINSDARCVCCSESGGNCISGVSPCAPDDASPSCGNPCPEGLSCVTVNGQAVCGDQSECIGPSERSCGNCGTQTRTCQDGEWSSWSGCG